jgi:hypothetical protein
MCASLISSTGLLSLYADEWPRPSFAMLRKGKPASFRLFPVGSYVVVCGAGSFLPTLFGLLKAIRWRGGHHASCAVSTPSANALASDSLSAGGPPGLIGGFGLPSFGCGHRQRFSTSRRRSSVTKLDQLEPEDLVEFFCQRLSSRSLAMPPIQPAIGSGVPSCVLVSVIREAGLFRPTIVSLPA